VNTSEDKEVDYHHDLLILVAGLTGTACGRSTDGHHASEALLLLQFSMKNEQVVFLHQNSSLITNATMKTQKMSHCFTSCSTAHLVPFGRPIPPTPQYFILNFLVKYDSPLLQRDSKLPAQWV